MPEIKNKQLIKQLNQLNFDEQTKNLAEEIIIFVEREEDEHVTSTITCYTIMSYMGYLEWLA